MKRMILVAVIAVMTIGVCAANADTPARDGMVAYSGTDAFTHLIPEERQACVNWLITGGKMNELCSSAVMKLVTEDPEAVTAQQRQALIAEATGLPESSGKVITSSAKTTAPAPAQTQQTTIKKDDNTGTIIAAGLIGLVAGLIIGGSSRRSDPPAPVVHHPAPQRPAPVHHNTPQVRPQQPQRNVNAPRPPRR